MPLLPREGAKGQSALKILHSMQDHVSFGGTPFRREQPLATPNLYKWDTRQILLGAPVILLRLGVHCTCQRTPRCPIRLRTVLASWTVTQSATASRKFRWSRASDSN